MPRVGHLQRIASASLAAGLGPEEHVRRLEVAVDDPGLQKGKIHKADPTFAS
jgi:hypothetical protein